MLTNEMKRLAEIVALKTDYGDLEVARSFVHKIRKKLEKDHDNVISILKHKKKFHTFQFNKDSRIYSKS